MVKESLTKRAERHGLNDGHASSKRNRHNSNKDESTFHARYRKIEEERIINRFEGDPLVQVLNGRYGPFIQIGEGSRKTKQNIRIPKDVDPKKLTRQMCLDLRDKSKK